MSAVPRHVQLASRERVTRLRQAAAAYWKRRPCFICRRYGWCQHREPQIADAEAQRTWGGARRRG